jgi:polar amino acid transport system substrate-binding protein
MSRVLRASAIAAIVALLAACTGGGASADPSPSTEASTVASASASNAPSASAAGDNCTADQIETVNEGRLTIGTDNPAFPPYWDPPADGETATDPWELGDPTNKRGFEGAVAWAVAEQMGFGDDAVDFIPMPFDVSFAPGEKDFDFYLAQVSFSDERAEAVDLSDGYFFSNQALVANAETPITEAASIAELGEYRLGVQVGTTSLTYIEEEIQPTTEASVFNSNDAAIAALNADQVDGIVVDLPTAFFITAEQMENGAIVGQFPPAGDDQEFFSLVLEQGSALTYCVNVAIATLEASGELDAITQEWMSENAGAPLLE